jgi:hypothetical protein
VNTFEVAFGSAVPDDYGFAIASTAVAIAQVIAGADLVT